MNKVRNTMEIEPPSKGRRKNRPMRTLALIMTVLITLLVGVGVYIVVDWSKIWGDLGFDENELVVEYETDSDAENLPEVSVKHGDVSMLEKHEGVIDIMLVGVDNRNSKKFTGRSDVTMIMRIQDGKIKLVSFMRDTLVEIEGHNRNRINAAFAFGSATLLEQTLQENFGIKPDYYMVVNFYGMEDIIDALGGVHIDVKKKEIKHLNNSIKEINRLSSNDSKLVKESGMQRLNGRQAVAYMRIRKLDNDAVRTSRQQTVLNALFKKVNDIDVAQMPGLISTLSEYVRTDIPIGTMLDLAKAAKSAGASDMNTFRYPDEYENGSYKKMSIVQPKDFDTEIKKLQDFLSN